MPSSQPQTVVKSPSTQQAIQTGFVPGPEKSGLTFEASLSFLKIFTGKK